MTPTARIYQFPQTNDREGRPPGARRSPLRSTDAPQHCRRPVSFQALKWAFEQPVLGVRHYVLLALANRAHLKTAACTPSMPELMAATGLSENTLRAHIQALAELGLIHHEPSTGGRRKRSTYTMLIESNVDSVVSTPQEMRGRDGSETPQELNPLEDETPQMLRSYPAADAGVVLRTKTYKREPGSTDAAVAATEPTEDGALFAEPTKPGTAVAEVETPREINGGVAVKAWCDAYAETHDAKPTDQQIGQAGREARALLAAGNPPDRVVYAAQTAGARGFATVGREYRDLARRRGVSAPPASHRPSTTDSRVSAGLALAAKYAQQEAG